MLFYILLLVCSYLYSDITFALTGAIGTPARTEEEYKITTSTKMDEMDVLHRTIKLKLHDLILSDKLKTSKLLKQPYFFTGRDEPYVYLDLYYDTKREELKKSNAIYRLRYRYRNQDDYLKSLIKKKKIEPLRVEIQSKKYIQITDGLANSKEDRLEFRDGSKPFINGIKAPKPPWPIISFNKYAKTGTYQNQKIIPYAFIESLLTQPLSENLFVFTKRRRMHLNIQSPWGSEPNPTQAFIITLDSFSTKKYSKLTDFFSFRTNEAFKVEVEIELERNISSLLEQDSSPIAKKAYSYLKYDLEQIKTEILSALKALKIDHFMSNESKYSQSQEDQ